MAQLSASISAEGIIKDVPSPHVCFFLFVGSETVTTIGAHRGFESSPRGPETFTGVAAAHLSNISRSLATPDCTLSPEPWTRTPMIVMLLGCAAAGRFPRGVCDLTDVDTISRRYKFGAKFHLAIKTLHVSYGAAGLCLHVNKGEIWLFGIVLTKDQQRRGSLNFSFSRCSLSSVSERQRASPGEL